MRERFDAWWLRPAPAERPAVLRVLVGLFCIGLIAVRGAEYIDAVGLPADQFAPVGIASILSAPLPASIGIGAIVATVLLAIPFTLGLRYRISGPAFAVLLLWITSYHNCWGHIGHGDNLVVLHVLVLAATPAADCLSLDARGRGPVEASARYGWPVRLMAVITVVTYALAGWAKLRFGGIAWLDGDVVRLQVAFDALRKARFGASPWRATLAALAHPWLFAPAAAFTVAFELFAPLALLRPRLAKIWAIGMWLIHAGIAIVMQLAFAYPLFLVAFAPLFRPERLLHAMMRTWGDGPSDR